MHLKIPETEQPVQGFFYAGGADQYRRVLFIRSPKEEEEGGDRCSSEEI